MKKRSLFIASAMIASVVAYPAFSAPTYFTDRDEFDAAAGGDLNFESFEADIGENGFVFDEAHFTDFTVSETEDGEGYDYLTQLREFDDRVQGAITDGTGALGYDDNDSSLATFSFPSPITAFGLDIATKPASTVTISVGDDSDYNLNMGSDQAAFWGVIDPNGITSITFDAGGDPDVGFDAVSYGEALEIQRIAVDLKFCEDPNLFSCNQNGVLPVTIFGTDEFEVEDIDMSTLRLCLADLSMCTDAPRNFSIEDRGNPNSDLGASMCTVDPDTREEHLNRDGFPDLDATFEATEVKAMLADFCGLYKNKVSGAFVITGSTLEDGTLIRSAPLPNTGVDQLVKKNR